MEVVRVYGQPEGESGSLPQLAIDTNVATEELREPFGDGEPQAGTALHRLAARSRVYLLEFLEDARLVGRGDADAGVDHLQCDPGSSCIG